jgi:hypothetical protein
LGVWRGRERRTLKKRKEGVEGIEHFGKGGFWGLYFSS